MLSGDEVNDSTDINRSLLDSLKFSNPKLDEAFVQLEPMAFGEYNQTEIVLQGRQTVFAKLVTWILRKVVASRSEN